MTYSPIFIPLLLISSFFAPALAADIQSIISSAGISAVFPNDAAYAKSSQAYNLRFGLKPSVVAYPTSADQVAALVKAGGENNMSVVARSGGHSYVANGLGGADGALVVDLSNMTSITIDSSNNQATIATGNRLGDVAMALNAAGRAIPHGSCPYVGIGGHSGHGGFGFASRMWGLTLDIIISMQVVLANGTSVTASSTSNPDLFWAMRGSASSFGITTSITVNTFAVPSYAIIFEYSWASLSSNAAASALMAVQSFVQSNIPPELGMEINIGKGSAQGNVSLDLLGGWYGAQDQLNNTLKPLLDALPPSSSMKFGGNGTWIDSVAYLGGDQGAKSLTTRLQPDVTDTFYTKSLMTPENDTLSSDGWNKFFSYLANDGYNTDLDWFMQVELYGGSNSAVNKIASGDTSFFRRGTMFTYQLYASSANQQPPYPDHGFTFLDNLVGNVTSSMPDNWGYGAYLNYIDDRLENWQELYYGSNYPRLQSIKAAVDPNNVFHFPISITAAQSGGNGSSGSGSGSGTGTGSGSGSGNGSSSQFPRKTLLTSSLLCFIVCFISQFC